MFWLITKNSFFKIYALISEGLLLIGLPDSAESAWGRWVPVMIRTTGRHTVDIIQPSANVLFKVRRNMKKKINHVKKADVIPFKRKLSFQVGISKTLCFTPIT